MPGGVRALWQRIAGGAAVSAAAASAPKPKLASSDQARKGSQFSLDPIGLSTYRDMMRDATVASALEVRKLGMVPGYRVAPVNETPPAHKAVEIIQACLAEMTGSPLERLHALLDEALQTGWVIAEAELKTVAGGLRTFASLRVRKSESFRGGIEADEYGNILRFKQSGAGGTRVAMPEDVIYWRYRGADYDFYGRSALYEAHDHWKAKVIFLRAWAVYLERHGMGTDVGSLPDDGFEESQADFLQILEHLQTGNSLVKPESWKVERLESTGNATMAYGQFYETCNKAIRTAILNQELATAEGLRVGSFAAAKVQGDVMWSVLRIAGEAYCEAMREQIFSRLLAWNGYPELPTPLLVPEPIEAAPDIITSLPSLTAAIQAGVLPPLTPDQAAQVLERYGFAAIALEDRSIDEREAPGLRKDEQESEPEKPKATAKHVHAASSRYADLAADFDRAEHEAARELSDLWSKEIAPAIAKRINSRLFTTNGWKTISTTEIRKAVDENITFGGDRLKRALTDSLDRRYKDGKETALKDAAPYMKKRKAKGSVHPGNVRVTPTQALEALKNDTQITLGRHYGDLTENVYFTLRDAAMGNLTPQQAADRLGTALIERGYSYDQCLTIVRTGLSRAFNEGRRDVFRDFEDRTGNRNTTEYGVIVGFRFNAILDAVTTTECRERHGLVFSPADVDQPPLHYNCRSTLEPVWSDDIMDGEAGEIIWYDGRGLTEPGFERKAG